MPEKQAVVTLHPLFLPDTLPFRSLTFASDLDTVNIGRASKREEKNMTPAHHNAWFESRVMSRDHAILTVSLEDKVVYVRDNNSMHGTWVNDTKITPGCDIPITTDDVLTFGAEVTRGSETFAPLRARFECQWPDLGKEKAASNPPLPQRPNSFCVPEDDDDAVDIVHNAASTEGLLVTTSCVNDLDSCSGEGNQLPTVLTPLSPLSNNDKTSAEHDSTGDDLRTSQGPCHAPEVIISSQQSSAVLDSEEHPLIAPSIMPANAECSSSEDYANSDYGSDDTDSNPGSVSSELDNMTRECDVWATNEEPVDFEEDSQCQFSEDELHEGSSSKQLSRASVQESHKPPLVEPAGSLETDKAPELLDPIEREREDANVDCVASTSNKTGLPRLEETAYDTQSRSSQNGFAEGPSVFDPLELYWSAIPKRNTPPPRTLSQGEGTHEQEFTRYRNIVQEFEKIPSRTPLMQTYPLRDSGQHDPCLVQASSFAPYQDGPFMASPPTAESGGASSAPNLGNFTYLDNFDLEDRLDEQGYHQPRQPSNSVESLAPIQGNYKPEPDQSRAKPNDTASGEKSDRVLGKYDERKLRSSSQNEAGVTPAGGATMSKGPLKRKANEMETDSLAFDPDTADPSFLEQATTGSFSLGAVDAGQESFSQDAQPRVSGGEAKGSASQFTDLLYPIEESRSMPAPRGQPPRKRVKTNKKSRAGSFATHATTAIVGALLGGLGTIVALASLPPGYFH